MLRAVALVIGAGAAFLVYLGFQDAWDGREYMWAVAVLLALISAGTFLLAEERRIAGTRAKKDEAGRQRVEELRRQDIHGNPSRDGRI